MIGCMGFGFCCRAYSEFNPMSSTNERVVSATINGCQRRTSLMRRMLRRCHGYKKPLNPPYHGKMPCPIVLCVAS